jgi:hypothetical protein
MQRRSYCSYRRNLNCVYRGNHMLYELEKTQLLCRSRAVPCRVLSSQRQSRLLRSIMMLSNRRNGKLCCVLSGYNCAYILVWSFCKLTRIWQLGVRQRCGVRYSFCWQFIYFHRLPYKEYCFSFSGVKQLGRGVDHSSSRLNPFLCLPFVFMTS